MSAQHTHPLPYIWQRYSRKIHGKLSAMNSCGWFDETTRRGLHFIKARSGSTSFALCLYWLVDPLDGGIVDSRYQLIGPTALVAAAEGACEWVVGKRYDAASEITAEHIERALRDTKVSPAAFPQECSHYLNLAVDAVLNACQICAETIDLPQLPRQTPLPQWSDQPPTSTAIDNWLDLEKEDQLKHIQRVLDEQIRPYIALDEGGVDVLELVKGKELIISYQGACVGCHSATGATLSSIQSILRSQVFSEITVIPKL